MPWACGWGLPSWASLVLAMAWLLLLFFTRQYTNLRIAKYIYSMSKQSNHSILVFVSTVFHILSIGNILMSPDGSVDYLTVTLVDNILWIIHSLSFCSPTWHSGLFSGPQFERSWEQRGNIQILSSLLSIPYKTYFNSI